jgi:nitroreductase
MNFRHACKLFDAGRTIPEADAQLLLETARLSPSSFGMQGWKIRIVTDLETKKKIKPHCWNQAQIDTCSHLLIFTTKTKDLLPYSDWVRSRFMDRGMPEDKLTGYYDRYSNFHKAHRGDDIYHWAARQCYIALGNVMTAAALLGIDSCPLEGFSKDAIDKILGLNTNEEETVVIVALGYRAGEGTGKKRLPISEIVQEFKIG